MRITFKNIAVASLILGASATGLADSKVFACKSKAGAVTYSQLPCADGSSTTSEKTYVSPPAVKMERTDAAQGVPRLGIGTAAPKARGDQVSPS
jgi:hypothetical protein